MQRFLFKLKMYIFAFVTKPQYEFLIEEASMDISMVDMTAWCFAMIFQLSNTLFISYRPIGRIDNTCPIVVVRLSHVLQSFCPQFEDSSFALHTVLPHIPFQIEIVLTIKKFKIMFSFNENFRSNHK